MTRKLFIYFFIRLVFFIAGLCMYLFFWSFEMHPKIHEFDCLQGNGLQAMWTVTLMAHGKGYAWYCKYGFYFQHLNNFFVHTLKFLIMGCNYLQNYLISF